MLGAGQVRPSRAAHPTLSRPQLFASGVLELLCLDCRRVSAEVFRQSMPLGRYWRLALLAGTCAGKEDQGFLCKAGPWRFVQAGQPCSSNRQEALHILAHALLLQAAWGGFADRPEGPGGAGAGQAGCRRGKVGNCPPLTVSALAHPALAEPPTAASEYAQAAAQAVLAPVLQGIRWLSQDSQALVLSQVTTAFLEVWMEHILAQKIKFR